MQIGKNLKKIRKQKELTQIQLAEISDISRNALINYEN
ncbi:helix-turn-helix transcriptional regulator, partial [Clostridioides difficile]|nr:helix-turn-helix transcriptional regulator [Clostridioides difficile]